MLALTDDKIRLVGAILGYFLASTASFILLWRGSNWRFRFLAAIVGLLPLYKAISLLARFSTVVVPVTGWLNQMVEAIVATLFLLTVLLLDLEIRSRKTLETRLRLAEAEGGWPQLAKPDPLERKRHRDSPGSKARAAAAASQAVDSADDGDGAASGPAGATERSVGESGAG